MNPRYINNYLKKFDQINPGDVGLCVAEGGQHYVFRYKEDQVIKIPKRSILMRLYGFYKVEDLKKSDQLLNELFPGYFLDTEVLASRNHRHYVIIQAYLINGEFLTVKNFSKVKDQFLQIVAQNRVLKQKHRLSLDYISFRGFFISLKALIFRKKYQAEMENLMIAKINDNYRLKIVDSNLLELKPNITKRLNPFHWLIDQVFFRGSKILIKDTFGIEI